MHPPPPSFRSPAVSDPALCRMVVTAFRHVNGPLLTAAEYDGPVGAAGAARLARLIAAPVTEESEAAANAAAKKPAAARAKKRKAGDRPPTPPAPLVRAPEPRAWQLARQAYADYADYADYELSEDFSDDY